MARSPLSIRSLRRIWPPANDTVAAQAAMRSATQSDSSPTRIKLYSDSLWFGSAGAQSGSRLEARRKRCPRCLALHFHYVSFHRGERSHELVLFPLRHLEDVQRCNEVVAERIELALSHFHAP